MKLHGRRLALTRPHGLGAAWASAAQQAGMQVGYYPLLTIEATDAPVPAAASQASGWIFISPSAVTCAWPQLAAAGLPLAHQRIAAPGSGTTQVLHQHGIPAVTAPEGIGDSERLLPLLPVAMDQHWILVRGESGRDTLARALDERGVHVHEWVCYRRHVEAGVVQQLLDDLPRCDALLLSSSQTVRALFAHAGESGRQRLQSTALVVLHPQIAAVAQTLGAQRIAVCESPAGLPQALAAVLDDADPDDPGRSCAPDIPG